MGVQPVLPQNARLRSWSDLEWSWLMELAFASILRRDSQSCMLACNAISASSLFISFSCWFLAKKSRVLSNNSKLNGVKMLRRILETSLTLILFWSELSKTSSEALRKMLCLKPNLYFLFLKKGNADDTRLFCMPILSCR